MKYFAYGSNMSLRRLQARVPDACLITSATLARHSLRFHKAGSDSSAKCDAFCTGDTKDNLWGAVFTMPEEQRPVLDAAEGLGFGYDAKQVNVVTVSGVLHNALTYYATNLNDSLQPYDWYLNHVLVGAREANLPAPYIELIEAINSIKDPDDTRSQIEFAIHSA